MSYNNLFWRGFQNSVLPAGRVGGPCSGVLPVQQHDVEILRIGELPQLIELFQRVYARARGDLGHEAVAIARNAFQGHAQHAVHLAIRFRSFEETNTPFVSVANETSESFLPKVTLHHATDAARAEGEASDF